MLLGKVGQWRVSTKGLIVALRMGLIPAIYLRAVAQGIQLVLTLIAVTVAMSNAACSTSQSTP